MKEYSQPAGLSTSRLIFGGLGILGGIWLIVAPFVLGYSDIKVLDAATKKQVSADLGAVTVNDIIVGVIMVALTGFCLVTANNTAMATLRKYSTIILIVAGVYLLAAPYLFDLLKVAEYLTIDKPNTNDQLMGLLIIIISGFAFQREFLKDETESGTVAQVTTSA